MTDATQLESPIIEIVGGEPIEFPRLTMDDIVKWVEVIRGERRSEAKKRHDEEGLSPFERQRLMQIVEDQEIPLYAVQARAGTPKGIVKALMLSLGKTIPVAASVDDRKKAVAHNLEILKQIHFTRQFELTMLVMSPPEPPKKSSGNENPPAESESDETGI